MTQAVLLEQPTAFYFNSGFGYDLDKIKVYKGSKGNKVYSGVPVFRSGTFRDSLGYENTWEDMHIEQMVTYANYLANRNILPAMPARDGHQSYLVGNIPGRGSVVGWSNELVTKVLKNPTDKVDYTYLLSDVEITEQYAQDKLDAGTWRYRSSEIGMYKTNDNVEMWPTYLGFAYVDIPAVEGLNFSSSNGSPQRFFAVDISFRKPEENVVTQPDPNAQPTGTPTPALPLAGQHSAPMTPAPAAIPVFEFSIGGQKTTDPTVAQNHINRLEAAQAEARTANRTAFVKSLVESNRIPVTQEEQYVAFALAMTDELYAQWNVMQSAQPVIGLGAMAAGTPGAAFQAGQSATQTPSAPAAGAAETDPLATAKDIVKYHRQSGMSEVQLKELPSYKKLVAAGVEL